MSRARPLAGFERADRPSYWARPIRYWIDPV